MILNALIGTGLSTIIAWIAYKRQSLTTSGVIAAIIFATMIYVFGGLFLWVLLMVFFISSSIITKMNKRRLKKQIDDEKKEEAISKSSQMLLLQHYFLFCFMY